MGPWFLLQFFQKKDRHTLVGGFNPFEKYGSNWIYFPQTSGWKFQKIFELPPPSYCFGTATASCRSCSFSQNHLGLQKRPESTGSKSKESNSPLPQPNPPNPSGSPPDMAVLGKGGGKRGGTPVTSSPPTKPSTLGWNELKHQVATNDVMRLDYPPGNDHISHPVGQLGRWFSELPQLGYVSFLEGIRFIN